MILFALGLLSLILLIVIAQLLTGGLRPPVFSWSNEWRVPYHYEGNLALRTLSRIFQLLWFEIYLDPSFCLSFTVLGFTIEASWLRNDSWLKDHPKREEG